MPANRFYLPQDGHLAIGLAPQNITGGVHSAAVNFTQYTHISAIVSFGSLSAAPGAITVEVCTAQNGTGATAIPFTLFKQETASSDVLSGANAITAAGYTPPATSNIFYVIEIDSAQIPTNATTGAWSGYNYLRVSIADGSNTDYASILFVLSGARYAQDQSPTVLV